MLLNPTGEYLLAEEAGKALPGVEQKVADTEIEQSRARNSEGRRLRWQRPAKPHGKPKRLQEIWPVWSEAEG